MPLSVNVGLSRKASKDYQSTGVSINVTAELDQSLLARPDELQQQIDGLYAQAEQALDRQAGEAHAEPAPPRKDSAAQRQAIRPARRNAAAERRPNTNGTNGGGMTESQRKAIYAIAGRLGLDAEYEVREIFGWDLNMLGVREASQVIDHLKEQQAAGSGRNGGGR